MRIQPHKGPCQQLGLVLMVTALEARTQAAQEDAQDVRLGPPGVRAPSPGWFNPHPMRVRGETGEPIAGAPRPDSEGPFVPAARIQDSLGSYQVIDPVQSYSGLSAAGTIETIYGRLTPESVGNPVVRGKRSRSPWCHPGDNTP